MTFDDLKLLPGYPLQIQVQTSAGMSERCPCRFVGAMPGRTLLLSVPRIEGKLLRLRAGQKIVARTMIANGVGVFSAQVEAQIQEPYPLLYLSYPKEVGFKGIRGATRVGLDLPLLAINHSSLEPREVRGRAVDISVSGARIELDDPLGELGDKLELQAGVTVSDVARDLRVQAVIRSRVERSTREQNREAPVVYGVEFNETDEDRRLLLMAYVFSLIAHDKTPG